MKVWEWKKTWPDKHTEKFVTKELTDILAELKADKDIIYIWELFEEREYPRENFSVWFNNFKDNIYISNTIKRIREILENRAVKWAMNNKLNSTFSIFHLKHNYKWTDKSEVENTNKNIDVNSILSDIQGK